MAKKAFFLKRLNDHIQYLNKINAALEGKIDFQGVSHHECQLGQWLYGEGEAEVMAMQDSRAKDIFDSMRIPHEQFHILSQIALEKKQAGDEAGAKQALTQMHACSTLLTNKLLELDQMN